jgi:hypothetical protein
MLLCFTLWFLYANIIHFVKSTKLEKNILLCFPLFVSLFRHSFLKFSLFKPPILIPSLCNHVDLQKKVSSVILYQFCTTGIGWVWGSVWEWGVEPHVNLFHCNLQVVRGI